jgi:methionyl-tRNA formyltransferase
MRYIFFGTPEFAAIVLQRLLDAGLPPLAVVCNPDRPVGRKKLLTPPPVKRLIANSKGHIEILQPEKLNEIRDKLYAMRPKLFIVAAYAKIIPQGILDIPSHGTLGVHPSLLPRLRGASPIQSAILTGEPQTGVSLYAMDAEMDHGPVYASERLADYDADRDTTATLLPRLAALGGEMLTKLLHKTNDGLPPATAQDHERATLTRKFRTEDAFIEPEDLAQALAGDAERAKAVHRAIRAFDPEPGAWTIRDGKRLKLLAARLEDAKLVLTRIQYEGKTPVTVA